MSAHLCLHRENTIPKMNRNCVLSQYIKWKLLSGTTKNTNINKYSRFSSFVIQSVYMLLSLFVFVVFGFWIPYVMISLTSLSLQWFHVWRKTAERFTVSGGSVEILPKTRLTIWFNRLVIWSSEYGRCDVFPLDWPTYVEVQWFSGPFETISTTNTVDDNGRDLDSFQKIFRFR